MVLGLLATGATAYAAGVYSGKVTGTVTVLTTTTTDPGAILALTNVTANGRPCTVTNPTTASCPTFNINEGQTSAFSLGLCNSGTVAIGATVTGTTTLAGSSIVAAQSNLPVFGNGCNQWNLTYTAPTTVAGTDQITINIVA